MLGGCHVTATRWTTGEGRLPEATTAHAAWPTPAREGLGATVTTMAAVSGSRTAVCWRTSPRYPCRKSGSATLIILTKKATTRWANSSATDSEPAGHWRTAERPRHWHFTCKLTSSISQSSCGRYEFPQSESDALMKQHIKGSWKIMAVARYTAWFRSFGAQRPGSIATNLAQDCSFLRVVWVQPRA